ncbi:MAG: hypothetical protein ACJAWL_003541 [Motiliproteus sp.]|jgi:hypothetical protein
MSNRLSFSGLRYFSGRVLSGLSRCSIVFSALSGGVSAIEPTQGMTITGDQELPQVLYIIPWKEQQPTMPAVPKLDNPFLVPLTPCDTGQVMTDYQATLWSCKALEPASKP